MTRNEAFEILKQHVTSDRLLRHCFAVESAMIAYAKDFGEDEQKWGNLGLLHDIDFEKYPELHPSKAREILSAYDIDEEFITSIESHACDEKSITTLRTTKARKTLAAVDQMSSFIVAVALMRPTKLEGISAKSVKKKMKDKAFAKAVDREMLTKTMQDLGVEFAYHIDVIVNGLIESEKILNEKGGSLF